MTCKCFDFWSRSLKNHKAAKRQEKKVPDGINWFVKKKRKQTMVQFTKETTYDALFFHIQSKTHFKIHILRFLKKSPVRFSFRQFWRDLTPIFSIWKRKDRFKVSGSLISSNIKSQKELVFCFKNKLFLSPKKTWAWRPRISKILEITRTIYSKGERSVNLLGTKNFFNLFLEVSQIYIINYNNYFPTFSACF